MSINKNELEKSLDDFTTDLIHKTNLFFKSFKELTRENLENYLDCIGLLDIWNTEEEKEFLWNTFYKNNIKGKVVESSVVKGMQEILSKEDIKNESFMSYNGKNEDYSKDDNNMNIIRLSFNRINSSSLLNNNSENSKKNNEKNIIDISNFFDKYELRQLKQFRNIMILLKYNNCYEGKFLLKLSQVNNIFDNYSLLKISLKDFLNYLDLILEKSVNLKNDEEFIINIDLYNLSLKSIENRIKILEKGCIINDNLNINNSNSNSINDSIISNSKDNIEEKIKNYIEYILNINNEFNFYINALKEIENSTKNCYKSIINNFKHLLSFKNSQMSNENIIMITDSNNDKDDELKLDIENNISYINKKFEEFDIFLLEIGNEIKKNDKILKNLNILTNRLIEKYFDLEREKNILLSNKKESEEYTNNELIRADQQIYNLQEEKNILKNKITELLEQIENLKSNNDYYIEEVKELENKNGINIKMLEQKANEINKLKLDNKNYKNKYDSLINDIIKINNKNKDDLKNHERKLIQNALNNIKQKNKIDNTHKNFINCNLEEILEQYFIMEKKYLMNNKIVEEKEKVIIENNKRINQLEIDLDLSRETIQFFSQENKDLKNKINFNDKKSEANQKESEIRTFNLEKLAISRFSMNIIENKYDNNNFTIFNNENLVISNNKEINIIQATSSGNLFAPPCLKIDNNNTDDNKKFFSNDNEENKDSNEEKIYVNTPGDDEVRNTIDINEDSINPYINDEKERNDYFIDKNKNNLFEFNSIKNNSIINSFQNLNINQEPNINNELTENKIINEIKNEEEKKIFTNFPESNNSLNNNSNNIENSLSLKDMENILLKKFNNIINISSYDYLHLFTNEKIKEIFSKIGENYNKSDVFSDMIYLLDKFEQLYKNIIFITKKNIYIIEPETYKIKYTFVRTILIKFTLSSLNYNIIVFHFVTGNDLVLMTLRRPEIISYIINTQKNIFKKKYDITFKYADEFNIKKDGEYYTQKIKSSINSTSFNFQTAIKIGYLIKINEGYIFTQYHEKIVVLTDFGLFYFDNPIVAPKRLVSIIGAEIKDLKTKFGEKLFSFQITTLNKYKIIFGSYCKEEYEEWLEILNDVKRKSENKNIINDK